MAQNGQWADRCYRFDSIHIGVNVAVIFCFSMMEGQDGRPYRQCPHCLSISSWGALREPPQKRTQATWIMFSHLVLSFFLFFFLFSSFSVHYFLSLLSFLPQRIWYQRSINERFERFNIHGWAILAITIPAKPHLLRPDLRKKHCKRTKTNMRIASRVFSEVYLGQYLAAARPRIWRSSNLALT